MQVASILHSHRFPIKHALWKNPGKMVLEFTQVLVNILNLNDSSLWNIPGNSIPEKKHVQNTRFRIAGIVDSMTHLHFRGYNNEKNTIELI